MGRVRLRPNRGFRLALPNNVTPNGENRRRLEAYATLTFRRVERCQKAAPQVQEA